MKHVILISLAALAFAGCAHHVGFHSSHLGFDTTPHYAQPSAIPCHGKGPIHYTSYYGSDAKWHYFESHHDLKLKRYMVPRWSLPGWKPVFPVGKGKIYVERDAQGGLRALPPDVRH
ncbi:MAG: hypothetical protein ABIZ56_12930 [Chthoniobacteraceae bacterium]